MILLNNGQLEVGIHTKGAELQLLRNLTTGINHMWSGDPAFWGKFSPILFPIVGQLKDNTYYYNGQQYSLPRHGFARDRVFQSERINDYEVVFTLTDDPESHTIFPFAFRLQVFYKLDKEKLITRYTVTNTGTCELYFSLGAHPAFDTPGNGDYTLVFSQSWSLTRWKLANGLLNGNTEITELQDHRLPLNKELFQEDALVMKGLPDSSIRLENSNNQNGIEFSWTNFPFFGIWAAAGAPFVCLEPWSGIADHVDHDQQFTNKEGILSLQPGTDWSASWQVSCF